MSRNVPETPVCILGLGLIGGCLLRDLTAAGAPAYGWNRSPETVRRAVAEGHDAGADLRATLARAEADRALVVIAAPMPAVGGLLDAIAEHAPSAGITDVVSVKQAVYDEVRARGLEDRYVGCHPMAGTADSGWAATREGLFRGAAWVVAFDHADDMVRAGRSAGARWVEVFRRVVALGDAVGAEVIPSRARHHDRAVARVSHLPHLLAEALAVVGDHGGALTLSLAAGSFRDGTRVAGTRPDLVRAMCEGNAAALGEALDQALELLGDCRRQLAEEGSVADLVEAGHVGRTRYEIRSGRRELAGGATLSHRPVIRVSPGQRGWVAQLEHAEHLGARLEIF
ncbi:prephenate dehydrogenase [Corynebacterium sphenisci]|uniref:prephenate dehydrogenase n=1 Tax=Corynebacterium sphenisci TaxID=191493 RepID=UPI0026E09D61|nr:prephenate dehydrogenase [Corynebacterium sphenisci]MDO5730411.1 prephenate dehydrogenase [Corynebacterium sphenisci]